MRYQVCNQSGGNMKKCGECNNSWCTNCATRGKGHYPKQSFSNICPYCEKANKIKSV